LKDDTPAERHLKETVDSISRASAVDGYVIPHLTGVAAAAAAAADAIRY